jgi:hypothetical protein
VYYERFRKSDVLVLAGVSLFVAITLVIVPFDRSDIVRNREFRAVAALEDYTRAQRIYHKADWDDDGLFEYAGELGGLSSVADRSGRLIGLIAKAFAEATSRDSAWHGYWFVDITADAEGPYDYAKEFGLCAAPAEYGVTGINTFIVNQTDAVYQKDTRGEPIRIWPDVEADGWVPAGSM